MRQPDDRRLQPWWNLTDKNYLCPPDCCQTNEVLVDVECNRWIDNTGQAVIPNEEVMLIFGGMTFRDRVVNNTVIKLFDMCEYYDQKYSIDPERRPETYKTCSEEIL